MAAKQVTTVLTKDKKCKSCVRFRGESDNPVTTALYVQNDAMEKLGNPGKVKVTVEVSK